MNIYAFSKSCYYEYTKLTFIFLENFTLPFRLGGHTELADRMTELVYEATDRMIYFLTGERPDHVSGRHYIVPRAHDTHEMTDVAKAARGKLQLVCIMYLLLSVFYIMINYNYFFNQPRKIYW